MPARIHTITSLLPRSSVGAVPSLESKPLARVISPLTRRHLHARIAIPPVPEPTPFVPNPETFLTLIGRSLSSHASKIPSWQALFTLTSSQLKDLGIEPARSRKYLLQWRDKFRRGEFGIGGDCLHVDSTGRAELRVVEVPIGSTVERKSWVAVHGSGQAADSVERAAQGRGGRTGVATLTKDQGMRRIVINVPLESVLQPSATEQDVASDATSSAVGDETSPAESITPRKIRLDPLSTAALDKAHPVSSGIKYRGARGLVGRHVEPIRGASGQAAVVRVKEGLWEHVRGHKIDGGERRQAEVRAKRRAAERRAGAR